MRPAKDPSFLDLIETWDGIDVVVRYDAPTGAWIFIAMHDDSLGRPVGGCRMKVYQRPEDGLRDALRLAEGMTFKWAAMDFALGGGKAVLAVPRPLHGEERRGLLRRFGALLNTLNGAFGTGADLGTTADDMLEIASVSEHVVGIHGRSDDGPMDPGPFTALGTFAGIKSALRRARGSDVLNDVSILVQGVGGVGEPLARLLAGEGGTVLLSDIDQDRAFAFAVEVGGSVVTPEDVYDTSCTVYAPCAVGATLNADTIPRLQCQIVAGAANNQLETPEDATRLADRGILWAPDYVINGGGAMAFTLISQGELRRAELERRVSGIGAVLDAIFVEAAEMGASPFAAAERRVRRTLARARSAG